jgi:hypothetical protein
VFFQKPQAHQVGVVGHQLGKGQKPPPLLHPGQKGQAPEEGKAQGGPHLALEGVEGGLPQKAPGLTQGHHPTPLAVHPEEGLQDQAPPDEVQELRQALGGQEDQGTFRHLPGHVLVKGLFPPPKVQDPAPLEAQAPPGQPPGLRQIPQGVGHQEKRLSPGLLQEPGLHGPQGPP